MTEHGQHEGLLSYVTAVWRRGRTLHLLVGFLTLWKWAVLLLLVGVAMDWLIRLPAPGRGAILAALLGVSLYKAWRYGWRHAGGFDATHTALRIEHRLGRLDSLLVTAVQLQGTELRPGTSASLRDLTCRRAEDAVSPLRPEQAVGDLGLRRSATMAGILAVVVVALAVANGPLLAAGAGRIFAPWMDIRYPTQTRLELVDPDRIVREGGSVVIQARLGGVIPSEAQLDLRTGTGKSRLHKLGVADRRCEYTIKAAFRGFKYRIEAGDARSDWHTVEVIASPRIERANVRLEFPEYTGRPVKTVEALTLPVPEGTRIHWRLTLDRAVSEARVHLAGAESLPLDVSDDGRTVTMRRVAAESRGYSFSWVEREHGFAFTSSRYQLQVTPDQRPHVELTSPRGNLYATTGRRLDLAFRGRDDHGIGESVVAYRVNKTDEKKVAFPTPDLRDGGEHNIDWDYRSVLPDLAVGDTVSFAIELTDRYPGTGGPHRARSETRRVTFLSKEDYLAHVARQKRRLLLRLRAIYREQRAVHDIVRRLDPADAVFLQTCQLEAVRQDLMAERMNILTRGMQDLIEDLAANNIPDETDTAALRRLIADMKTIAAQHVRGAASSFRSLASTGDEVSDPAASLRVAVHQVNTAGRELGCLMLQLGYRDASEVMARELHAAAQTQASLRLRTIMPREGDSAERLSGDQKRLAQWLSRLLAATPRGKESTVEEALVAFELSRLVKRLLSTGVDAGMHEAVALIGKGKEAVAARLQAEAIQALLHAEFRLRLGAEYEALAKARDVFLSQAAGQKALRAATSALAGDEFDKRRSELLRTQVAQQRQLQLLLMPSIPAPRPGLFDAAAPPAPPVHDLLAAAENALGRAAVHIEAGDPGAAAGEQKKAQECFEALAKIVQRRIGAMTQGERVNALAKSGGKQGAVIEMLQERLLGLLEKTGDVAADGAGSTHLARQAQALADDAEKFRLSIDRWHGGRVSPGQGHQPVLDCLRRAVDGVTRAVAALKENRPSQAIPGQEVALGELEEAGRLVAEQSATHYTFAAVIDATQKALAPSGHLADIEAEQRDMMRATREARPADLAGLVIPQKNLIHAVDAVLSSLDVLAHRIESGSVMLFAKTDMDAAGVALAERDVEEAVDAQSYVADTLRELQDKIDAVTPEYRYVLEVVEFLHELAPEGPMIRAAMRQLRAEMAAQTNVGAATGLAERQRELEAHVRRFGEQLRKLTGQQRFAETARQAIQAVGRLKAGDDSAAQSRIDQAAETLASDAADLGKLMENLAYLVTPPPSSTPAAAEPTPEVKLVKDILALAALQKDQYRQTHSATREQMVAAARSYRQLEKRCAEAVQASKSHPHLVAARRHLAEAARKLDVGSRAEALASQREAGEALRYFVLEYALKYVDVPPPPPPGDPAPSEDVIPEDDPMTLFMPGAVTGSRPKDGRVEWEVLGRRDRAALNENFARELPLEYRAILRDYYERLAK